MLKYALISSGVLPLMMSATVWQHSALQTHAHSLAAGMPVKQRDTQKREGL